MSLGGNLTSTVGEIFLAQSQVQSKAQPRDNDQFDRLRSEPPPVLQDADPIHDRFQRARRSQRNKLIKVRRA